MSEAQSLERFPIHLGLEARAVAEPEFAGMEWYQGYAERHASDGTQGRLVSLHRFAASWTTWEMHPLGAEVVVCVAGKITCTRNSRTARAARSPSA